VDGLTTRKAACELLSSGGIPAVVGSAGNAFNCNSITDAGAPLPSTITLAHIWVSFLEPATNKIHYFNPSYKTYTFHAGINLPAKMGLTAGAVLGGASSGMQSGTAGSSAAVGFVSNLNAESLNSTLQSYGTNLLTSIQNKYANKSVDELVGGTAPLALSYDPLGRAGNRSSSGGMGRVVCAPLDTDSWQCCARC
jgi:hypothetical protein